MNPSETTIAVVGGTGKEGSGLALRWAAAGYTVVIGSRDGAKAAQKAEEIRAQAGANAQITGTDNLSAAQQGQIVTISVPYDAHGSTLDQIKDAVQGKILIDVTVPINPAAFRVVNVPPGKSACLEAQERLGSDVRVVAAFQNVGSWHLTDLSHGADCDVLVCSDSDEARNTVIQLAKAAGMRGLDAGPLANAVAVEAMTPVLLHLNKRYKAKSAGIIITGLPTESPQA